MYTLNYFKYSNSISFRKQMLISIFSKLVNVILMRSLYEMQNCMFFNRLFSYNKTQKAGISRNTGLLCLCEVIKKCRALRMLIDNVSQPFYQHHNGKGSHHTCSKVHEKIVFLIVEHIPHSGNHSTQFISY